jgi:hypothetical protein
MDFESAIEIFKKNWIFSNFHSWVPVEVFNKNNKEAIKFIAPQEPNIVFVVGNNDGCIYVYSDGEIEYEYDDHIVTLSDLKKAQELIEEQIPNCSDYVFESIIPSENDDKEFTLSFIDCDAQLYRPIVMVDLKLLSTEYIPDHVEGFDDI